MTAEQWVAVAVLAPAALIALVALVRGYSLSLRLDARRRDHDRRPDDRQ